MAGDQFVVVDDAAEAREIAQRRERLDREAKSRRTTKGVVSLEDFMSQAAAGEKRQLNLIIKADQGGPVEALADALQKLSQRGGAGRRRAPRRRRDHRERHPARPASGAIIIGFHVRPDTKARAAAEREGVDIKLYRIIYEAVADVRAALEGMLRPEQKEVVLGEAEVRETLQGLRSRRHRRLLRAQGHDHRPHASRLVRDGVEVYDGKLGVAAPLQGRREGSEGRATSAASASRTSTTSRSAT